MADTEHDARRVIGPATWASLALVGSLVLGALWVRSGIIGADRWPIQWLDVEGELHRTSATQIQAAAAGPAQGGFFAADLGRIRAEIEALPWIAHAEVSRHWPDALHLRVIEHRPVARWNDDGLLSDRGELFVVTGADGMQGLPQLVGPEGRRDDVLSRWQSMRRSLAETGLDIERIELDERGAWTLELANGVELLLGREQVEQRLARFIAIHDALRAAPRAVARVDMRYTNGVAVRWLAPEPEQRDRHG